MRLAGRQPHSLRSKRWQSAVATVAGAQRALGPSPWDPTSHDRVTFTVVTTDGGPGGVSCGRCVDFDVSERSEHFSEDEAEVDVEEMPLRRNLQVVQVAISNPKHLRICPAMRQGVGPTTATTATTQTARGESYFSADVQCCSVRAPETWGHGRHGLPFLKTGRSSFPQPTGDPQIEEENVLLGVSNQPWRVGLQGDAKRVSWSLISWSSRTVTVRGVLQCGPVEWTPMVRPIWQDTPAMPGALQLHSRDVTEARGVTHDRPCALLQDLL